MRPRRVPRNYDRAASVLREITTGVEGLPPAAGATVEPERRLPSSFSLAFLHLPSPIQLTCNASTNPKTWQEQRR